MLDTPIAICIYRRPELTARVLQTIARIQPRKLFVVADGPSRDQPDDGKATAAARAEIEKIDWDGEVLKNYSDVNLGCGKRVASGISWVFEHVDKAIILEDDCVPDMSFYRFCEELLDRYQDDERVMQIEGSTYQREAVSTPFSYFFTCFSAAWGWATWRRAWKYYDINVKLWPLLKDTSWLTDLIGNEDAAQMWANAFEHAYRYGGDVTWDYQWTFACWANSGLSIRPRQNLISNIGCIPDATHTFNESDFRANLPTAEMKFPLIHPPMVLRDRNLDRKFVSEVIVPLLPDDDSNGSTLRRVASRFAPEFVKDAYRTLVSRKRQAKP